VSATFIFLMLILKVPIIGLFSIVWWAVHSPPEPDPVGEEGGGTKRPLSPRPRPRHPRPARPRNPRRGPQHGATRVAPPPRVRTVVARARRVEH
jgi:hypothetical protein